ncbi:MAG: hypothetical protein AAFX81_00790 [Pseudomonadota bacterium]
MALSWQQEVGALTAERERVETAVRLIKRFGAPTDVAQAELTYADGKAEADALIATLQVALDQGRGADEFDALERRLHKAIEAVDRLAAQAKALVPPANGQKDLVAAVLGSAVLVALIEAAKTIYLRHRDDDALRRVTIRNQLDAARWPTFAAIRPE